MRPDFNTGIPVSFLTPNIGSTGRLIRASGALVLLAGALVALGSHTVLGVVLLVSSAFVFFEAFRGWCALRACGIKTKF